MKLRDFFSFILSGVIAHQSISITSRAPSGWQRLCDYAIGVEFTFPFFVILLKRLKLSSDDVIKASLAYQSSFLLIGIGVALGWLTDRLFNIKRD